MCSGLLNKKKNFGMKVYVYLSLKKYSKQARFYKVDDFFSFIKMKYVVSFFGCDTFSY